MILYEDEQYKVMRVLNQKGNKAKGSRSMIVAIDKALGMRIDPALIPVNISKNITQLVFS